MLSTFLFILFAILGIVLIVVILLQEGRGGGFGQALGEHGQQTFGVAAQGIHKFTGWVAFLFLASAVLLHVLNRTEESTSVIDTVTSADPTNVVPAEPPPPKPK